MSSITMTERIPGVALVLIGAVFVGLLMVLISWAAPVLTPIMVAAFLAALAAPIYFWLQKKGMSSSMSLVLLVVLIVVAILAIAGLLWISSNRMIEDLAQYQTGLEASEPEIEAVLAQLGITQQSLSDAFTGEKLAGLVAAILGGVASFAGDLMFALVLVAFLLIDSKRLYGLATNLLADRPFFGKMPDIAGSVVTYFSVRTRLNLITGVGFGLVLWLLGIDYALLWGLLAFVLSYIPYVGLFTAMIPPTVLALAEFGVGRAIAVLIAGLVINLLIENIIEPRFTGKVLNLSPVVVIISFFFWGWLLGPTGAMLSMPITVMIMLVTKEDKHLSWISSIIGSSGDSDEADESVEKEEPEDSQGDTLSE